MTEIIIRKNTTPANLKKAYDKINSIEDKSVSLILPSSLAQYRFGLFADILKLIITLNAKLKIQDVKFDFELNELDRFYEQEYGYTIVSLLWNTSKFIDKAGNNIKSLLRKKQNELFVKMNSLEKLKGNKQFLVNTDHLSKSSGLIRLLETPQGFNDDEEQIKNSVKKILTENILTFNKKNLSEIEGIIEDIGAIVYELTKNTYEWGRTDSNSVEMSSSIRGVYLRFHKNKNEKLIEEYAGTPLETFFNHPQILNTSLNHLKQIYYLEVLVFDSGVGFIEKFNPKNGITDINVIKKCLIKNQTSSTSNLKSKKGKGLDRILQILNQKGFLKISTDKYNVYRDLVKNEYQPVEKDSLESLVLEDWNQNDFNSSTHIKSQGSFLNILYPFKYETYG